ncbi:hypothetical protein F2Q70_00026005 [Brassica cretica]|uniref:Uncharacterized protein n=1 Tax=Brassica cretica TaxID=69181 RepID=A0A8S9LCC3_BRACR|nr:hypothetical protein F2Q68_00025486 [Brassica cretica]KAF2603892.1 hypothetical protein F2Q70_00026005 [Brassica cretica]
MELQSYGENWCQQFDITPHQLNALEILLLWCIYHFFLQFSDIRDQMDELYYKKKTIHASIRSIGETSKIGDVVHQPARTERGSVQDKSRPEGVKKDKPDRQAGDNQKDSCVRHPAAETSDD